MLKRFAALFVLLTYIFALGSSTAYAQEIKLPPAPAPSAGEPDVGEAISPMKINQRAPFTGLLLSPAAVAKIMVELKHADDKIKVEVEYAVAKQKAMDDLQLASVQAQLAYVTNTSKFQIDNRDQQIADITKRLEKEEASRPNVFLYAGGGFLLGAAVVIGTVLATRPSN